MKCYCLFPFPLFICGLLIKKVHCEYYMVCFVAFALLFLFALALLIVVGSFPLTLGACGLQLYGMSPLLSLI